MLFVLGIKAANAQDWVLESSNNQANFGAQITLTATGPTAINSGTVTFYDGTNVLGAMQVSAGTSAISTILLTSGSHSLTAYYGGFGSYPPNTSQAISEIILPVSATTFRLGSTTLPQATQFNSIAVGDFNGDGLADLAIVDGKENNVTILLGNGDGTFQMPVKYTVGTMPQAVAVGDFNGDGIEDLAVANSGSSDISILLGKHDGTFKPQMTSGAGSGPVALTVGDFNQDGFADLAVCNETAGTVSILLGNGNGAFQTAVSYPAGYYPLAVVVIGDAQNHGIADLAIAGQNGTVTILLGDGHGRFPATTTYSIPGALFDSLAEGDFNGDGIADLVITTIPATATILLGGTASGMFSTGNSYPLQKGLPGGVVVGDFNGDSIADIAVAINGGAGGVGVLLGEGNGNFANAITYQGATNPLSLVVGDFNGDGRADLAVTGAQIMLGAGPAARIAPSGSAPQPAPILMPFSNPLSVTVTDSSGNPVPGVTVTFSAPPSGPSATLSSATAVTDNSGMASVNATANSTAGMYNVIATVGVAGVEAATFALTNTAGPATTITASGGTPQSAVVGSQFGTALQATVTDAGNNPVTGVTVTFVAPSSGASALLSNNAVVTNSAGVASVMATANATAGSYVVTAQVGQLPAATFALTNTAESSAVILSAGPNPSTLGRSVTLTAKVAPANATGKVTLYNGTTLLGVAQLISGAAMLSTIELPTGTQSLIARYHGNGSYSPSISAIVEHTVTSVGGTTLSQGSEYGAGTSPIAVATGDFTGSGNADLAVANSGDKSVSVFIGHGDGTFSDAANYMLVGNPQAITIGDFNGDGYADLAVATLASSNLIILLNKGDGSGTFGPPLNLAVENVPTSIAVADFNSDGNADVAVALGSGGVSILLGNGDGTFGTANTYPVETQAVAVADFDGDGNADLAAAGSTGNVVTILSGHGDGTFTITKSYPVGNGPGSVAVADFNGDGKPDLATANSRSSNVSVLLNNGDGTFETAKSFAIGAEPLPLVVGDFNGDGNADLAAPSVGPNGGSTVSILLGDGMGGFGAAQPYGSGTTADAAVVGDFNGDGRADLAAVGTSNSPQKPVLDILLGAGPATSLSASAGTPQTTVITVPFATARQATVNDASGNPVSGVTVTFLAPATGASAALTATSAVTNGMGIASVIATANSLPGTFVVTASISGIQSSVTFNLTNVLPVPAYITVTSGGNQSAQVNSAFSNSFVALITSSEGIPVAGANVTFTATQTASGASGSFGGSLAVTVPTNAFGVATAPTFTANSKAGSYTVSATVGTISPAVFSVTNAPGAPSTILATSGGGQSVQAGSAFANALIATVTDANGNPVPSVAVTFTAPPAGASGTFAGGAISVTIATTAAGVATAAAFTANVKAGTYLVNATAGEVGPASFTLTNAAGAASTITASAGSSQSAQTNHAFSIQLAATVQDANGNPIQGATVTFAAPMSGASGNFGSSGMAVVHTNSAGVATAPPLIANSVAGSYGVSAKTGVLAAAIFGLTNTPGPPGSITATSGSGQTAQVMSAFSNRLVATVDDANGNPVPNASVTFTAAAIGAGATFSGGTTTATVQTDASGIASSPIVTAGTIAGSYMATAIVAGAASPASFALTNSAGPAASITATSGSGQTAPVKNAFGNPLVVIVKDAYGNPASANVTFNAPASGASGTFAGGGLISSAPTNTSGVASSPTFTANATSGQYLVSATVGTLTAATFTLTNMSGAASTITVTSGNGQTIHANSTFGALAVTVKDANSNPLSGVSVTFTAPPAGASGTFAGSGTTATVQTSGVGAATAPVFTGNGVAGAYMVTATVAGLASQAAFSLTNLPALAITTAALMNGTTGQAYTAALTGQNGIAPYAWSVSSGSLPAGLTLNAQTGIVAGIPTADGTFAFSITVTDGSTPAPQTATQSFSLLINPSITVLTIPTFTLKGLPPNGTPGTNITDATIQLSEPSSIAYTGTLTLAFTPRAAEVPAGYNDAAFLDSKGKISTTMSLLLPAATSSVPLPTINPGTVAGDILVQFTVAGQNPATSTITVKAAAPIIEADSVQVTNLTAAGFDVEFVATSTTRDATNATITFAANAGAQISGSSTFTVDVSSTLAAWFASSSGLSYGGAFSLTLPFTLSGSASAIQSVSVTLANSMGTSAPATGSFETAEPPTGRHCEFSKASF